MNSFLRDDNDTNREVEVESVFLVVWLLLDGDRDVCNVLVLLLKGGERFDKASWSC
jgi:hypothetical protein